MNEDNYQEKKKTPLSLRGGSGVVKQNFSHGRVKSVVVETKRKKLILSKPNSIKSSIGMGSLLWAGIGDTIRVSLSADPVEEIKVGFNMLKSLNLRHRGVNIISCPSCARHNFNVINTVGELEKRLEHITTPMTLSVIGCVVNGPGEAKETDIGLTGGKSHQIYLDGEKHHILREGNMIDHLVELCEKKQKELLSKS